MVAMLDLLRRGEMEDVMAVEPRGASRGDREGGRGMLDDRGALDRVAGDDLLELEDVCLHVFTPARASPVHGAPALQRRRAVLLRDGGQRGLLHVDGPVDDRVRDEVA